MATQLWVLPCHSSSSLPIISATPLFQKTIDESYFSIVLLSIGNIYIWYNLSKAEREISTLLGPLPVSLPGDLAMYSDFVYPKVSSFNHTFHL